jgi:energy-coupling factor transporter transmembrane protein EcfT
MMMQRRYFFPYLYPIFMTPIFVSTPKSLQALILGICVALGFVIKRQAAWKFSLIVLTSLTTLFPFLVIVQTAVCSSPTIGTPHLTFECLSQRSLEVLLNLGLTASVILLAVSNEWRLSLVETANGMSLPRSIRTVIVLSGSTIGEFRKATLRVHHAFTSRGEAAPTFHWRNLVVLPRMLGCIWASVLRASVERLDGQWSSERFWDRFIPAHGKQAAKATFISLSDFAVIFAAGLTLLLTLSPT